jgi:hypothetical protein
LRRNSDGRATLSRPRTPTVAPGGTDTGPDPTSTIALCGERTSRRTSSGIELELCRKTVSFLPNTAVVSVGSSVTVIWPGASTTRSI